MKIKFPKAHSVVWLFFLATCFLAPRTVRAKTNEVTGKIQFAATTNVEKTSGVWIDGQYVGYLHELKGSNSIMLLPGVHTVSVRQNGYKDYTQQVSIQPGETTVVPVAMAKDPADRYPAVTATLKIDVNPSRAAVFVDGQFVGHVGEFEGMGHGLLVAPGKHRIKIALPGYQTFETDVTPIARQKVEVKTRLAKSSAPLGAPIIDGEESATKPSPGNGGPAASLGH